MLNASQCYVSGDVELIPINMVETPDCSFYVCGDISGIFNVHSPEKASYYSNYGSFCGASHYWYEGTAFLTIPYSLVKHFNLMVDWSDDHYYANLSPGYIASLLKLLAKVDPQRFSM